MLQQHLPDGSLRVRWVRDSAICVEQRELDASFLLTPEQLSPNWRPAAVDEILEDDLQPIIALAPQVLIVGTGARQRFLPAALLAKLMRLGIGVECMDNGAAARTFNLLADESRRVVAAFLIAPR